MVKAQETIDLNSVKPLHDIADNTNQHFWFNETGVDTGAHITEVPQEEWEDSTSPNYHKGSNLLARSTGIAIRDGLTELAQFSDNTISLGKNSYSSAIYMCHDCVKISASSKDDSTYGSYMESAIEIVNRRSYEKGKSIKVRSSESSTNSVGAVMSATGLMHQIVSCDDSDKSRIELTCGSSYKYNNVTDDTYYGLYCDSSGRGSANVSLIAQAETDASGYSNRAAGVHVNSSIYGNENAVHFQGSRVTSQVAITVISDRRLKSHVGYIKNEADEFIRGLKPVHYKKDGRDHTGFYAQDVHSVDKWDCMTDEKDGYMVLGYTEIIAPLVAYCQHLEERISKLEA